METLGRKTFEGTPRSVRYVHSICVLGAHQQLLATCQLANLLEASLLQASKHRIHRSMYIKSPCIQPRICRGVKILDDMIVGKLKHSFTAHPKKDPVTGAPPASRI